MIVSTYDDLLAIRDDLDALRRRLRDVSAQGVKLTEADTALRAAWEVVEEARQMAANLPDA